MDKQAPAALSITYGRFAHPLPFSPTPTLMRPALRRPVRPAIESRHCIPRPNFCPAPAVSRIDSTVPVCNA
jgi:hypothetical protein